MKHLIITESIGPKLDEDFGITIVNRYGYQYFHFSNTNVEIPINIIEEVLNTWTNIANGTYKS